MRVPPAIARCACPEGPEPGSSWEPGQETDTREPVRSTDAEDPAEDVRLTDLPAHEAVRPEFPPRLD